MVRDYIGCVDPARGYRQAQSQHQKNVHEIYLPKYPPKLNDDSQQTCQLLQQIVFDEFPITPGLNN